MHNGHANITYLRRSGCFLKFELFGCFNAKGGFVDTLLNFLGDMCTLSDHLNVMLGGHSWLGYYFWVSNGLRTILDNFTYLVCLDLYCGAYFGSYLHFILHIEYTDKVNLQGIGSSKISF